VQNSLCVQVLRCRILAALLHGTPAAGISQTLRCSTRNGITELSQTAPPIFGWAAITLGIGPHSSLFIAMQVHETVSKRYLNVAIHCFGTILKVESLEKRLGLGLARSQTRSRLVAKIRRLGLVSVSWNCRKVLVSVSSRSRKLRSRLHRSLYSKSD